MKIFLYNNDFTEQSIRQMETVLSFIDSREITIDKEWKKHFSSIHHIRYINFEEFMKSNAKKVIMFFNIIDGQKLCKYRRTDKNCYLVFRPRGITPEESFYKNKSKIKKLILDLIESKVVKSVDYYIFLSDEQKSHFILKYPRLENRLETSSVLPNVKIQSNKYVIQKEINPSVKIVYSGGFSKWQNIEQVFKVVSDIALNSNIDSIFTILTFEENFKKARALADYYNIAEKTILKYVLPEKLDEELIKHDIGIIIRDDSIVNLTASPFKTIDYITNGLALIATSNIVNQVKRILESDYYFELEYKDEKVYYSKEEVNKFISNIMEKRSKSNIIKSYNDFIYNIDKIEFNKIFR